MQILIAGGSGPIGTALTKSLLAEGHQVAILTRYPQRARLAEGVRGIGWDGRTITGWGELASRVDAIVNLAGESLGSGPWTRERKTRILSSRVESGKAIYDAIRFPKRLQELGFRFCFETAEAVSMDRLQVP